MRNVSCSKKINFLYCFCENIENNRDIDEKNIIVNYAIKNVNIEKSNFAKIHCFERNNVNVEKFDVIEFD